MAIITLAFVVVVVSLVVEGSATVDLLGTSSDEGSATLEDHCTDVSYWDLVKYDTTSKQCCDTKLDQICTFKNDQVCKDVLELQCEVVAWAECTSTPKTIQSKKCEVKYKNYAHQHCNEVKISIKQRKKVPDCKEVSMNNCVTDWLVDAKGTKVWAGTETCTPVTWEECQIVEKEVEFPTVQTECTTDSIIKWANIVDVLRESDGVDTICEVKKAVDCKTVKVNNCAQVAWQECRMKPVEECHSVVIHTPSQEKIHKKKCLVSDDCSTEKTKYCPLGKDNTMCQYCGVDSANCGPNVIAREITSDVEKDTIVDKHNELRRGVAKGEETQGSTGPQPSASNMNKIVWDDEVAKVAQTWADQCPPAPHDPNRRMVDGSSSGLYCGQNVLSSLSSRVLPEQSELKSLAWAVEAWYNEVKDFDKEAVNKFYGSGGSHTGKVGHYTQVVWGDVDTVGCGYLYRVDPKQNNWYRKDIVCNYCRGGNLLDGAIYYTGDPASACPEDHPNLEDGLCAK